MTAPLTMLAIRLGQPIKTRASDWLARLGPMVVFALLCGFGQTRAQAPSVPASGVDAALIEDIVIGSRILADFGVLDGFGHVSARHPTNPSHFLMSRSLAPALVTAAGQPGGARPYLEPVEDARRSQPWEVVRQIEGPHGQTVASGRRACTAPNTSSNARRSAASTSAMVTGWPRSTRLVTP